MRLTADGFVRIMGASKAFLSMQSRTMSKVNQESGASALVGVRMLVTLAQAVLIRLDSTYRGRGLFLRPSLGREGRVPR